MGDTNPAALRSFLFCSYPSRVERLIPSEESEGGASASKGE